MEAVPRLRVPPRDSTLGQGDREALTREELLLFVAGSKTQGLGLIRSRTQIEGRAEERERTGCRRESSLRGDLVSKACFTFEDIPSLQAQRAIS